MSDESTRATIDEEASPQRTLTEHPAEGRYGWYVETDRPTTDDGIVVGDYISISSHGDLYVWGPAGEINYAFDSNTWDFVFPQFKILGKVVMPNDSVMYKAIFLGNLEDPRTMSKQPKLTCEKCAEGSLCSQQTEQLKH